MKLFRGVILVAFYVLWGTSLKAQTLDELMPCDALANVRTFMNPYPGWADYGMTGFISNDGIPYLGWYNPNLDDVNQPSPLACALGQYLPGSGAQYQTGVGYPVHTALPVRLAMYSAPGETFKSIQRAAGVFLLSDQGNIYNWGQLSRQQVPGEALHPLSGTNTIIPVNASTDCSFYGTLRKVSHPENKKWVHMQVLSEVGYAADESGQWWVWGKGNSTLFPNSQVSVPTAGSPWTNIKTGGTKSFYIPVKMDRLTPQPLIPNDPDMTTFVGNDHDDFFSVGKIGLSYIGTDSLVYSYNINLVFQSGQRSFTSGGVVPIALPQGVKARKIQRGIVRAYQRDATSTVGLTSVDYVLGTDGNIYKFVEGIGPATLVSLGSYKFQDFIVRGSFESGGNILGSSTSSQHYAHANLPLDLVVRGGTPLVAAQRNELTDRSKYNLLEFGPAQGMKYIISKLWPNTVRSDDLGYTIIKDAASNNVFALSTIFNESETPFRATGDNGLAVNLQIGLGISWQKIESSISTYGPHKLINCIGLGRSSTSTPAAGTIDCSKTQIVTAPVAGTPNQHALVVTVNVTTAGSFSPLSVSGSGMSLANGVTSVTATATGVQQFQIPIKYDGSALTNNFQFTIGSAGSCTADLTLQSNPVLKNVYTLQNCTAITPGTLSK